MSPRLWRGTPFIRIFSGAAETRLRYKVCKQRAYRDSDIHRPFRNRKNAHTKRLHFLNSLANLLLRCCYVRKAAVISKTSDISYGIDTPRGFERKALRTSHHRPTCPNSNGVINTNKYCYAESKASERPRGGARPVRQVADSGQPFPPNHLQNPDFCDTIICI